MAHWLTIRSSGKYQVGHWMVDTELDFATAKKPTLDAASADVLYLLDSCHASTAAIKPGKELIAASAVKTTTLGLRAPYSFTAAIIQELNQAVSAEHFLTAAALLQNTSPQASTRCHSCACRSIHRAATTHQHLPRATVE